MAIGTGIGANWRERDDPRMRTARWFILVALVGLLVTACGGSDDPDTDAVDNDPGTATISAPAPAEATATLAADEPQATATATAAVERPADEAGDEAGNGSDGTIDLVGAVNATIDEPGSCGKGVMGDDYQVVADATDAEDNLWLFQIYISNFEDTPGEYEVGADSSYKKATVTVTDGMGTSWETNGDSPGVVVVSDDLQSGTIETTLTSSDNAAEEIHVAGAWVCDAE